MGGALAHDLAHGGDDVGRGRPRREHGGHAGALERFDVGVGHDAADDHRDVAAGGAQLLDHERHQRHVRARQHRQADGVDVLVDGGAATISGVWNSPV